MRLYCLPSLAPAAERKGQTVKNWKDSRNYRRIRDEYDNVVANIITINNVDIEVSEEVFLAYSQMDRRDRYLSEDAYSDRVLSLDRLEEDNMKLEFLGAEPQPSAEALYLEKAAAMERDAMRSRLISALNTLDDRDMELISAMFFEGVSAREYARRTGVSDMAVRKRRDRILKNLKNFLTE